jgi:macrodomain Ter protein organizer (MatP/YcbG family)|tara:strand:- start:167 stop:355 length:189 start_codon:yes stop_codon:yes gene_type:complete
MPDTKKYKSVAVPFLTWEKLWDLAERNHRSPAQQIAFLVDLAEQSPNDTDIVTMYASLRSQI